MRVDQSLETHVLERLGKAPDARIIELAIDGGYLRDRSSWWAKKTWNKSLSDIGVAVKAALSTRPSIELVVLKFPDRRDGNGEAFLIRIRDKQG
ncbi:hypothetical protein BH11MYX1_BH11MYX1_20040 [soil metagenome]